MGRTYESALVMIWHISRYSHHLQGRNTTSERQGGMSGKIIEMRRPGGDHVCGYYYDRAAALMSEGRYGEAEALIADGREAEPFNADLARSLNNRSPALAALGLRTEALADATEAVKIYRELAATHPDTFNADLAWSLNKHPGENSSSRTIPFRTSQSCEKIDGLNWCAAITRLERANSMGIYP